LAQPIFIRLNRKYFKLFFIAVVFIGSESLLAQNNTVDSLKQFIQTSKDDSIKVNALILLSKQNNNDNPQLAIQTAEEAKNIALKIAYKKGFAFAAKNIGLVFYNQGNYVEAINNWQEALKVFDSIGDKTGVANMLSNQGAVYFNQGDDAKSLELHLQSLKLSEEVNDTLRILTSYTNIGAVYLNKKATYDKALKSFLESYKLSVAINDNYSIGTAAVNLGEVYFKMGDDSTALFYLKRSLEVYEDLEDKPYSLNYVGRVYTKQRDYLLAIQNHKEAYEISKKIDAKLNLAQSSLGMAQAYLGNEEIKSAIPKFEEAVLIAQPLNANMEIKEAYEGLVMCYTKLSDFSNASKYQTLLLNIKDTIYNINTDKKLGTLQFTFDLDKKQGEINLLTKDQEIKDQEIKRQKLVRNGFIGGFAIVALFAGIFLKQRNRISKEKKRSDELLLNILPAETAEELKATGTAKAKSFDMVTVLFTDFKNFTQASELLSAEDLVKEINYCYSAFDKIITKHNIEKIKTIGDAYMCAGGLPATNSTHPTDVVKAGLEMQEFIARNKKQRQEINMPFFELRLGIHTGPVVAGIVGIKKFAYDIWGDTVNTASRMESSGEVGKVNISGTTYEIIKDQFVCTHRGKIQAKNKGEIDMYFVEKVL